MDGWNTGFVPWNSTAVDPASEKMFSDYTKERAKLQPFLYAAYKRQGLTGVPVCRALMVDYDNYTAAYTIEDQYLLGDGLMVAPVVAQNATERVVHFPPGDDWVSYWANTTTYAGGSIVAVPAPLTTLPLFQRKGSVLPLLDLDDDRVLVLKTHDVGNSHHGLVYDDDGISTNAELHDQYFSMSMDTSYESTMTVTLTTRVDHAQWNPTWQRVRWEVVGSSFDQWEAVTCGGMELPRVQTMEDLEEDTASGWMVVTDMAILSYPIVAEAGWETTCTPVRRNAS